MRLRMTVSTGCSYDAVVPATIAELRVLPRERPPLVVLGSTVECEPVAWQQEHRDYWGTRVLTVHASQPHADLTVKAGADLEFDGAGLWEDFAAGSARSGALSWADLAAPDLCDRWVEYLGSTTPGELPAGQRTAVQQARATASKPADAVPALARALARLEYAAEPTPRILDALRAVGVPARFVGGLRAAGPLTIGRVVDAVLTSWVEFWDDDWIAVDSRTGVPVSPNHIPIGHGRDRSDVQPLRAVHSGAATATSWYRATMTRLA